MINLVNLRTTLFIQLF